MEEAFKAFTKVVSPAEAKSNLGMILAQNGKNGAAKQAFRESLEMEPDAPATRAALAQLEKEKPPSDATLPAPAPASASSAVKSGVPKPLAGDLALIHAAGPDSNSHPAPLVLPAPAPASASPAVKPGVPKPLAGDLALVHAAGPDSNSHPAPLVLPAAPRPHQRPRPSSRACPSRWPAISPWFTLRVPIPIATRRPWWRPYPESLSRPREPRLRLRQRRAICPRRTQPAIPGRDRVRWRASVAKARSSPSATSSPMTDRGRPALPNRPRRTTAKSWPVRAGFRSGIPEARPSATSSARSPGWRMMPPWEPPRVPPTPMPHADKEQSFDVESPPRGKSGEGADSERSTRRHAPGTWRGQARDGAAQGGRSREFLGHFPDVLQ